jgi:hypothetical protein
MYTEVPTIDETEGMDAYSTVVHTEAYPSGFADWPNVLGVEPTDEEDHYLIVWTYNHNTMEEIELLSTKAFRCPTHGCDGRVLFTQDECYHCNWGVPPSFKKIKVSLDWNIYMMEQAFMTDLVPISSRLSMMEAVRMTEDNGLPTALELFLDHVSRYDDCPHSLAGFYGPLTRILWEGSRHDYHSSHINSLATYDSLTGLVEEAHGLVSLLIEEGVVMERVGKLCWTLGQIVLKQIHMYAYHAHENAMLNMAPEAVTEALIRHEELAGRPHYTSATNDDILFTFLEDPPQDVTVQELVERAADLSRQLRDTLAEIKALTS